MSVHIEIVNYKEVDLWLDQQSKLTERQAWEVIASTALKVMDSMKRYILPSVITGRLRASVHVEKKETSSFPYADDKGKPYQGKLFAQPGENEVYVGTNVVYAKSVDIRGRAHGYFDKSVRDGEFYMDNKLKRISGK